MADTKDKQSVEDLEAEVWNAIAAFEQILEAMPNDRVSLETLSDAYEKVGDRTRAKDYLIRLADVLMDESNVDGAQALLGKLRKYEAEDPEVAKALTRIESLVPDADAAPATPADAKTTGADQHIAVSITGELAFAWNLLQARELTQEDYSRVVEELSDASTANQLVTVSVLHVLRDLEFMNLSRIMAFAGGDCGTPIISLTSFELRKEAVGLLPLDFMIRRGAIVYELIGRDALVAVMNPYDQQLRKDIEERVGKGCHYFLAPPTEFDAAIEQIREMDKE